MISPKMHTRWHRCVCVCVDTVTFQRRGGFLKLKSQSAKICPNFNFQEGGYSETEKVKVPRSAQISIFGGGGGILKLKKSKCQDLPKFQFSGGGVFWNWKVKVPRSAQISIFRGGGYSETEKSKRQDLPKFQFSGGVFWNWKVKVPRSAQISIFRGGGSILKLYFRIGVFCRIWTKISTTPAGSCITVVSHILRMWRLINPLISSMIIEENCQSTLSEGFFS